MGVADNYRTERQAEVLEKFGYDSDVTFDEASEILDELAENNWQKPKTSRRTTKTKGGAGNTPKRTAKKTTKRTRSAAEENPCTEKQAACLEKNGYDSNVSFDEASAIIEALAENNWEPLEEEDIPSFS